MKIPKSPNQSTHRVVRSERTQTHAKIARTAGGLRGRHYGRVRLAGAIDIIVTLFPGCLLCTNKRTLARSPYTRAVAQSTKQQHEQGMKERRESSLAVVAAAAQPASCPFIVPLLYSYIRYLPIARKATRHNSGFYMSWQPPRHPNIHGT